MCIWWESKMVQLLRKKAWRCLQKLKRKLKRSVEFISRYLCKRIDSRVSNRYLNSHVYSSIIHTSQELERAVQSSSCFSWSLCKRAEGRSTGNLHMMFMAISLIVAQIWKQSRCLSARQWIKKLWYLQTV